ncbi:MAG: hypothetical protein ACRDPA_17900 [Solirubrobacteraceae bacterium]
MSIRALGRALLATTGLATAGLATAGLATTGLATAADPRRRAAYWKAVR